MEIRVNVTKENKDKVLRLISELVEAEAPTFNKNKKYAGTNAVQVQKEDATVVNYSNYLKMPQGFQESYLAQPDIKPSPVGSWYMFNSFFASKAILRVLSNLIKDHKGAVPTSKLLDVFYNASKQAGLLIYRGFPKEREKTRYERSNITKLRYFILWPLADMGFVTIEKSGNKDEAVHLTKFGLELSQLRNPKLDEKGNLLLSEKETEYLVAYLKHIDSVGYKENTMLRGLYEHIKGSRIINHEDIVNWFAQNPTVIDYIYAGSRAEKRKQSKNSDVFRTQMGKAALAFASAKIALLRELGVLEDKRGSYNILRPL